MTRQRRTELPGHRFQQRPFRLGPALQGAEEPVRIQRPWYLPALPDLSVHVRECVLLGTVSRTRKVEERPPVPCPQAAPDDHGAGAHAGGRGWGDEPPQVERGGIAVEGEAPAGA